MYAAQNLSVELVRQLAAVEAKFKNEYGYSVAEFVFKDYTADYSQREARMQKQEQILEILKDTIEDDFIK